MSAALRRFDPWPALRGAPIALPQLLALLALVTLDGAEGGFPLEHWAPAGVLIALLASVAVVALPVRGSRSIAGRLSLALLVLFALWTVASLVWADDRGAAAVASTRTALLATTFVLFARWPQRPRTAVALLAALTVGLGLLAWAAIIGLAGARDLDPWFLYDRLLEPIGYVNAGAAFWGITAFLAVALIGGRISAAYRLLGAAVVVPAAGLSLLCLSRGGLLASAIVAILILALLPGRARNGAALAVAALGTLVAAPSLLDVGEAVRFSTDATPILHTAIARIVAGTVVALGATFAWTRIEAAVRPGDPLRRHAARAGAGLIAAIAAVLVVLAATNQGPITVDAMRNGARTITQGYAEQTTTAESRLSAGLNSGRWDFWTVAWNQFEKAPILGDGADNYRQDYLLQGRSPENPRYPHSMWLRALGQLGIVGVALLLGWVVAVALCIRRLAARPDPAGRAVAVGAAGAFGMWVVHGSADWLMEYGGLSAIVAAIAGLAVATSSSGSTSPTLDDLVAARAAQEPATDPSATSTDAGQAEETAIEPTPTPASPSARVESAPPRRLLVPVGSVLAAAALLLVAVWTASQWVADRDRAAAGSLASDQPERALHRAERARSLEPFGEQGDMLIGALAVRRGDLPAALTAYRAAFDTNGRAARPRLWLGVVSSALGDEREAKRWLRRAARAAPRDALIASLKEQVAGGVQLSPLAIQQQLAQRTAQLVRDPDPVAAGG